MREGFQRKSFNQTTSAFSIPSQAKVPDAGFTKHSKISLGGERRKVLPQFAGPYYM